MANKKKARKKTTRRKPKAAPRKSSKSAKKSGAKKTAPKRAGASKRVTTASHAPKKRIRAKAQDTSSIPSRGKSKSLAGDADFQGTSNVERADSESVSELLEEGNTFEAGAVRGVEEAEDADEREVRTREFPEDDVPEEYLDQD